MSEDVRRWLEIDGEIFLRQVGLKKGQTVLDFGCGAGNYTIPAAKIAGEKGKVYALDREERLLNRVLPKAEASGLHNIEIVKTEGELHTSLADASMDAAFLYDVLYAHSFPRSAPKREELLKEVHRVLKPKGLLSVYPMHGDPAEVKQEIEAQGFRLEKQHSATIIAFMGSLTPGQTILDFRKT